MRKLLLLAAAIFACGLHGSAQLNSLADYNRVNVGWDGMWTRAMGECGDVMNGIRAEYLHGFDVYDVACGASVYVSTGISASYNKADAGGCTDHIVTAEVPVNISYSHMTKGGWYVEPFCGPHIRANVAGWTYESGRVPEYNIKWSTVYNWFDYPGYKRCQIGGQVGVNCGYGVFNFCVAYRIDSPLYNAGYCKMTTNSVAISVGVNF